MQAVSFKVEQISPVSQSIWGKNWLKFDIELIENYTDGDQLTLVFTKKNCKKVVFDAGSISTCEGYLEIQFDIDKCFDQQGKWKLEIYNQDQEKILTDYIEVYNNSHV